MISAVTLRETNIHSKWMKIIYLNLKLIYSAKKKEEKRKLKHKQIKRKGQNEIKQI